MKIKMLFFSFVFLGAFQSRAGLVEEDLRKADPIIVQARIGVEGWFYFADPVACACWAAQLDGKGTARTSVAVSCAGLKSHNLLAKHLKKCISR